MRILARQGADMRGFVLLLLLCVALVAAVDKYTTRFDHIDVDSILRNERALNSFIKCILEKGPCSPEGRELKTDLPDALRTHCNKCSDAQKRFIRKASRYVMAHRPEDWQKIVHKLDPDRKYSDRFNRFLSGA